MRNSQGAPTTCNGFEEAVRCQFIRSDYEQTVIDKMKRCKQQNSASDYAQYLQRLIPALLDLFERENWEKFVNGLKPTLK